MVYLMVWVMDLPVDICMWLLVGICRIAGGICCCAWWCLVVVVVLEAVIVVAVLIFGEQQVTVKQE